MSKLLVISGRECVRVERMGFYRKRQTGSHIVLRCDDPFVQIVVPDHKVLDRGTLRVIIRQANLSIDEFVDLMD